MQSLTSSVQESQSDSSDSNTTLTGTSETKPRVRRQSLKAYEKCGREENISRTVPSYGYGYFTKEKGKNKSNPPSPPLTVGGVGVNKKNKIKDQQM